MSDYQLSKIYAEAMEAVVDYPVSVRLFLAHTVSLLERLDRLLEDLED